MNITYGTEHGILTVEPDGSLQETDFEHLASEIDRLSEDDRDLRGMVIHSREFPGYDNLSEWRTTCQIRN